MFQRGDHIQRKYGSGINGIVIGPGQSRRPNGAPTVKVYRLGLPQRGIGNWFLENFELADRALTDDEWAEFVKFLLTEGE